MIEKAIIFLKEKGIEAFELSGVLVIPVSSPENLYSLAKQIKRYLVECGYEKSWMLDPYYYEHHKDNIFEKGDLNNA